MPGVASGTFHARNLVNLLTNQGSGFTASTDTVISEHWIWKHVEGSNAATISGTILTFFFLERIGKFMRNLRQVAILWPKSRTIRRIHKPPRHELPITIRPFKYMVIHKGKRNPFAQHFSRVSVRLESKQYSVLCRKIGRCRTKSGKGCQKGHWMLNSTRVSRSRQGKDKLGVGNWRAKFRKG